MNKLLASLVVGLTLTTFALADSGTASNEDGWTVERGFAAVGDLLVVRPLGAAATVGGFGLFAVASPFAAMADGADEVFDTLVTKPGEYTFVRDLGDFNR
ncbi:MAG: multidrug transporter [Chitinophagia bacterium]|nr:multidrug transporter [Chitinophagia bacterium]